MIEGIILILITIEIISAIWKLFIKSVMWTVKPFTDYLDERDKTISDLKEILQECLIKKKKEKGGKL